MDFIETGNRFTNAIVNIHKLLQEFQVELELRDIWQYDNLLVMACPSVSIVFDNASPQIMNIGSQGRCRAVQNVNLVLYLYLETLVLGSDTMQHVERMGRMSDVLFGHNNLYGLCHTEALTVNSVTLGARRLDSEVYLTGQFNITVPQRFCLPG